MTPENQSLVVLSPLDKLRHILEQACQKESQNRIIAPGNYFFVSQKFRITKCCLFGALCLSELGESQVRSLLMVQSDEGFHKFKANWQEKILSELRKKVLQDYSYFDLLDVVMGFDDQEKKIFNSVYYDLGQEFRQKFLIQKK